MKKSSSAGCSIAEREQLNAERVQAFLLELESLASLHEGDAEKMAQLKALYLYAQELVS